MENKLKERFGLFTAISMVIGVVIGSGAFFKAQDVLTYTGGDMTKGIIAWICSGLVMLFCAICFSRMAKDIHKCGGIVDYAEYSCGKNYAYYVGWFMATIYCPTMTSFLAIASSKFICALVGFPPNGAEALAISGTLLVLSFTLNSLAPKLSGKFQVTTTVIKLIPLIFMGIVGTIYGLSSGITLENFSQNISQSFSGNSLFKAIVATSFAYEGWIVATSINAEIKSTKKNLPKALTIGSVLIIIIYVFYFIGLAGSSEMSVLISQGPVGAFKNLFGNVAGTILNVFALMCCLGSLNGLTVGSARAMYSVSIREKGLKQNLFSQVDKESNMPVNSCLFGLMFSSLWMLYYFGANMTPTKWFGLFSFDSCDLPVVTVYALYIPVFIGFIKKLSTRRSVKDYIFTILAIVSCLFMIFCAFMGHGIMPFLQAKKEGIFSFPVLFYLIIFILLMLLGFVLEKQNRPQNPIKHIKIFCPLSENDFKLKKNFKKKNINNEDS